MKAYGTRPLLSRLLKHPGCGRAWNLNGVFHGGMPWLKFLALTGKAHLKLEAGKAAIVLNELSEYLDFIELSTGDILQAAADAQSLGVRGGGIHDLLHARAAQKSGAKDLLTMDQNDFERLVPGLSIEQV